MFTAATLDRLTEDCDVLDLRTTDEIEAAADELADTYREVLTGLPARPGTRR